MAIPSTGAISMNDIQTEFGGVNPINLNEYYPSMSTTIPTGYGIPASGPLSLGDFRGTQSFSLNYITAIDANALGTNTGGSTSVDVSANAGKLDRWIVLATGMAEAGVNIVSTGASYTIAGTAPITVFNSGFSTDSDGHRVAIVYKKINNSDTSITVAWTNPYYNPGTGNIYFEPDRGHVIFVYELVGIPTMGTVNSVTGSGNTTADMILSGSTKHCAILITTTNTTPPASTMTNATIAPYVLGRHASFYDTNMGASTVTYTTDVVNYGCFGGAAFPY